MRYVLLYLLLSGFAGFAADTGPAIDPQGGIRAATSGDEGPGFDPNGRPSSLRASSDEGNGIDPHG